LGLTDEPISVHVSYLLKGVGKFLGWPTRCIKGTIYPSALHALPRFSQSEAHMSHFVMNCSAQPFNPIDI
jgi:hypothetical protein